jgi:hypothetical protein
MMIRRAPRDTEGIGSLKAVSALDPSVVLRGDTIGARNVEELIIRLGAGARASLANPSRLHGMRAEAMFRAVLVALGSFELLVEEDEGQVYFDDVHGPVKLPDYRAVDGDGRQVLIEVKTVPPKPRQLRHSISTSEFEGLRRYGELTGTPVSVAHYWSAFNAWTLVDLHHMQPDGRRFAIDVGQAMRFNQMSRFGDRMIGTKPPLELRLEVEELRKRVDGNVARIQVTGVKLRAAGEELTDELERQIAFSLFRFGKWQHGTPVESGTDGRIHSISLKAVPPEEDDEVFERQEFAVVGVLSSMYSALFNEVTLNEAGAVERLDHHSEPGEFGSLIPPDFFKRPARRLRLWVLEVQPSDS